MNENTDAPDGRLRHLPAAIRIQFEGCKLDQWHRFAEAARAAIHGSDL